MLPFSLSGINYLMLPIYSDPCLFLELRINLSISARVFTASGTVVSFRFMLDKSVIRAMNTNVLARNT